MKRVKYLFLRGGVYIYIRKVPKDFAELEPRKFIKVSLKTSDFEEAVTRNSKLNKETEKYFSSLILNGASESGKEQYERAVKRAQYFGLTYKEVEQVAESSKEEFKKRLDLAEKHLDNPAVVEAVLGGIEKPNIKLSNITNLYFDIAKGEIKDKNRNQVRIWKNSRLRAMRNFIEIIGDLAINDATKNDALNFRDHWLERLTDEGLAEKTANKELGHIDKMIRIVCEQYRLPFEPLFSGLKFLGEETKVRRLPFSTDFIIEKLLAPNALSGLSEAGRSLLHLMAETGARPSELVGLDDNNELFLDSKVPYIHVKKNEFRTLKTSKNSEREIPLIGYSLKAAQNGAFEKMKKYQGNPSGLTEAIRMYFKRHEIMPSKQYTLYSMRHSFDDRMTAADVPERIKAQLMGHKYSRPTYGLGGDLALRQKWMSKFTLSTT